MKNLVVLFLAVSMVTLAAGCSDEDDCPVCPPAGQLVFLVSPNGGETVNPGGVLTISWAATSGSTVKLSFTDDSQSGAFTQIASGLASTGTFDWTTPGTTLYGVRIRVEATDSKGTNSDLSDGTFAVVATSPRGYVTSSVCQDCHPTQYDNMINSGHPWKLSKVVGGTKPTWPFTDVPNPPTGYTWNDITYVIGGYGWKARFMDDNGYILTDGWNNVVSQYNLPRPDLGGGLTEEWVPYHANDTAPKPYTCGTCHTTGWQSFDVNGGVNQDGLVGILGTWEEPGIRCEQCHNAGGTHVASQKAADINIDRGSELCGSCHFRDTNHRILASGGFIRHHEQYDEMISAKHGALSCTSCHEPHIGVRHGNAALGGIKVTCESCHPNEAANNKHLAGPTCVDCHMGRASKSARKVHDHEGDVRTHIFKISTDPVFASDPGGMFFVDDDDGALVSNGYVTLDFACYGCHKNPDNANMGGPNSPKSLVTDLVPKATGIHTPTP